MQPKSSLRKHHVPFQYFYCCITGPYDPGGWTKQVLQGPHNAVIFTKCERDVSLQGIMGISENTVKCAQKVKKIHEMCAIMRL